MEAGAAATIISALGSGGSGDVLCFLPGAGEIRRLQRLLETRLPASVKIVPLHGNLATQAQDIALQPCADGEGFFS